ncbi:hypothetical protein D3C81_1737100 [compost metagenome]
MATVASSAPPTTASTSSLTKADQRLFMPRIVPAMGGGVRAGGAAINVDVVGLDRLAVVGQGRDAVAGVAAAVGFHQVLGDVVGDVPG